MNYGWQNIVNNSEIKECEIYTTSFFQKAEEAEKVGNIRQQAVFRILGKVTL